MRWKEQKSYLLGSCNRSVRPNNVLVSNISSSQGYWVLGPSNMFLGRASQLYPQILVGLCQYNVSHLSGDFWPYRRTSSTVILVALWKHNLMTILGHQRNQNYKIYKFTTQFRMKISHMLLILYYLPLNGGLKKWLDKNRQQDQSHPSGLA